MQEKRSDSSAVPKNQVLVKPEKPSGFLDFLPGEFLAREAMLKTIDRVFRSYGYDPIETPIVEFSKVLTGEDETSKNIFAVSGQSRRSEEEPMSLRFDQTVPLARFVAANPYNANTKEGIKLPWRRMVLGPVFRGESAQKGRYRQFYQFDVDIVGASALIADAEIVAIIYDTLQALGVKHFLIKINNRKILNGLSELIGLVPRPQVSTDDVMKAVFRSLDKISKIGLPAVLAELAEAPQNDFDPRPGLDSRALSKIQEYVSLEGDNEQKLAAAAAVFADSPIASEGIQELRDILILTQNLGVPAQRLLVDFTVARGLDYYTGPVMETVLTDAPEYGSVFSGGRYNNLMERFTGQQLPAVGASIGVDRLFAILEHLGTLPASKKTVSEVVIIRIDRSLDSLYLSLARDIRALGYNVEVCLLEDKTFKSQFNFALSRGADYMVIVGSEEAARQTVKIKNILTRQQTEIGVQDISHYFPKK